MGEKTTRKKNRKESNGMTLSLEMDWPHILCSVCGVRRMWCISVVVIALMSINLRLLDFHFFFVFVKYDWRRKQVRKLFFEQKAVRLVGGERERHVRWKMNDPKPIETSHLNSWRWLWVSAGSTYFQLFGQVLIAQPHKVRQWDSMEFFLRHVHQNW